MWKAILSTVKATFPVVTSLIAATFLNPVAAQQNIIANKDNTRPEITRQYKDLAGINSLSVTKYNGYNEVRWASQADADIKDFIVEYSVDGEVFLTAGRALPGNGSYSIKHYTNDTRPMSYRIKSEQTNGRFSYSAIRSFDGTEDNPVRLQSTTVRENVVNIIAAKPVQRINVYSRDGAQVYARDIGGQKDFISTTLPDLGKGMYFITFYGDGWKNSQKINVL